MQLRNFRFYSDTDGGGASSQGDGAKQSQGDDKATAQGAETKTDETTDEAKAEKDKKLTAEAAKHRTRANEAEAELAKIRQQLEELENNKLTDEQKVKKDLERLQREAETAKREAKDAQKLLLSTKAVAKHGLPEDFAMRLIGDDEDTLNEDAKGIAALIDKLAREKYRTPAPDLEAGNRNGKAGITEAERAANAKRAGSSW